MKEEKRERKARNKVTLKQGDKWLSNVSKQDAKEIRKTFPQVIEGPPKQTGWENVERLVEDGLVGLYSREKT